MRICQGICREVKGWCLLLTPPSCYPRHKHRPIVVLAATSPPVDTINSRDFAILSNSELFVKDLPLQPQEKQILSTSGNLHEAMIQYALSFAKMRPKVHS